MLVHTNTPVFVDSGFIKHKYLWRFSHWTMILLHVSTFKIRKVLNASTIVTCTLHTCTSAHLSTTEGVTSQTGEIQACHIPDFHNH